MILVSRGNESLALLPVERRRIRFGPLRVPGLGFLYAPLAPPSAGVLLAGDPLEVCDALASHLLRDARGWCCLSSEGLDAASSLDRALTEVLGRRALLVARRPLPQMVLRVEGTWGRYLLGRGSDLRRNLRRAEKRLSSLGGVTYAERPDDGAGGMEGIETLDTRSWRMHKPEDVAKNASLLRYCRELLTIFPSGEAHVFRFLLLDGRPIAGFYGLRLGNVLHAYKTTYDLGYERCSPGTILLARVFEECFAAELERIELMGRNRYLSRWANDRRYLSRNLFFNPRHWGIVLGWLGRHLARSRVPRLSEEGDRR